MATTRGGSLDERARPVVAVERPRVDHGFDRGGPRPVEDGRA
jgi:hypothetical protein